MVMFSTLRKRKNVVFIYFYFTPENAGILVVNYINCACTVVLSATIHNTQEQHFIILQCLDLYSSGLYYVCFPFYLFLSLCSE